MKVRIATFNIYWFPSSSYIGNRRSQDDRKKLREVIKRLDADILVFQEILDLKELEDLLSDLVPARSYRLQDEGGQWAASGTAHSEGMKVPLAFDSNRLELIEVGSALKKGASPATKGKRDPVAARLKPLDGGSSFTIIGVHLKSGILTVGPMPITQDDFIREEEMLNLTEWITTLTPITPGGQLRPSGEPTVLIGDFNAVRGNAALKPLSPSGKLSSWSWLEPRFASALLPSPVQANFQPDERWTTHLDKEVIDHVIVSPEVNLIEKPWVYAFDQDNSWLQAVNVHQSWLEERNYTLTPQQGAPRVIENLHRISDHRPVRVTVEL